jgi:predicted ATPase/DNA-binding CsgD family transcriptional regulator
MAARMDSPIHPKEGVDGTGSPGRVAAGGGQPLPLPLSSFVGREREIGEVETLLGQARLVTLTGAGGSGKTRLAIEAARRAASSAGVEAAFVDLAPISDPALVKSTVATALGILPVLPQTATEALVEHLRPRRLLLVLDNLEQLLPTGATPVAELLSVAPDLRVLATSRAPLHVRGEHEYRVDPLSEAEAEDLFVDRARAVEPHLALTDEARAAIAQICRRLDRLPLAIELAAAQARLLTAPALLRRLEQGVALPQTAPVDAPARQRTLRDAIAWSYGLLDRTDQVVLARSSGFVGGFTGPAAEASVPDAADDPPIDVPQSLGRLVDYNLLRVASDASGEPRFSLLETIREFARDHVSFPEAERFRERHARFFMEEVVKRTDYGAAPSPPAIGDDLENVRAALTWAEASGQADLLVRLGIGAWVFFGFVGRADEAGRWLEAAERSSASAEPLVRAALLQHLARHELAFGGDRRSAADLLSRALAILEDSGDAVRATRILELLSHIASDLGDRPIAVERMRQATSQARGLSDRERRARFLAEFAISGTAVYDLAEMKALAEEALHEGRELDDAATLVDALMALGYVALANGEKASATRAFDEALSLHERAIIDPTTTAVALGVARLRFGDVEGSRSLLIDAMRAARRLQVTWVCLTVLEAAADWLGATSNPRSACVLWATIDSVRERTLDRTAGNDMGLFAVPRERDRNALTPAAFEAAIAIGRGMSLDDALAAGILDLSRTDVGSPNPRTAATRRRHDLTEREHEVLQLLAAGRSDGQIAEELFISKKTAAVHVANIKGKLGAGSRVEIVTIAIDQGLVERPGTAQPAGR